jgi:hypothetical protein
MMQNSVRRRRIQLMTIILAGLGLLCLAAAALAAWSNRNLPVSPQNDERLSAQDEALLQEVLHLKDELGESIWPGWGQATIPMLLFNDSYAFLTRHPAPPFDWEAVNSQNNTWVYYRYPLQQMEKAPQNFAEQVSDVWSGSIATRGKAEGYLIEGLQQALPDPLETFFPYKLAVRLILPTDQLVAAALHENFHAYQALVAPGRFADAELAYADGDRYWTADAAMHEAWQTEIELLVQALQADQAADAADLAGRFLAQRQQRRLEQGLDPALVAYEQRLEWLEGLAMYVEFSSWRTASNTPGYQSLPTLADDPGFHDYHTFERHWSRQLGEMKRQATQSNDIRFYFSGMAQAVLLDRLMPDWKDRTLSDAIWIETLLAEAIQQEAYRE